MSDLISRSALLQKFNDTGIQITFDLPVEEILGEDIDIDDFTMLVQDAIRAYKNMVIGTINEQPTAYDIEKVVAELENKAQDYRDRRMYHQTIGNIDNAVAFGHKEDAVRKSILIVRKGGVE